MAQTDTISMLPPLLLVTINKGETIHSICLQAGVTSNTSYRAKFSGKATLENNTYLFFS